MTDHEEPVEDPGAAELAAKARAVFAQAERDHDAYLATLKQREAAGASMEQRAAMSRGAGGSFTVVPPRSTNTTPPPASKPPRKRS